MYITKNERFQPTKYPLSLWPEFNRNKKSEKLLL